MSQGGAAHHVTTSTEHVRQSHKRLRPVFGYYAVAMIETGKVVTTTTNIVAAAQAWVKGTCWGGGDTQLQATAAAVEMAQFFGGAK